MAKGPFKIEKLPDGHTRYWFESREQGIDFFKAVTAQLPEDKNFRVTDSTTDELIFSSKEYRQALKAQAANESSTSLSQPQPDASS